MFNSGWFIFLFCLRSQFERLIIILFFFIYSAIWFVDINYYFVFGTHIPFHTLEYLDQLKNFTSNILDILGNYTCFKNNHPSVVDYALASNSLLDSISNFMVFPQSEYSDHCQITVLIHNNIPTDTDETDKGWYDLKAPFKWDIETLDTFTDNLRSNETNMLINNVNTLIDNGLLTRQDNLLPPFFYELPKNPL